MALGFQDVAPGGAAVAALTTQAKAPGDRKVRRMTVTGDAAYPVGGYPITAAQCGFANSLDYLEIVNDGTGPAGGVANLAWFWNRATQKLQLIVVSTGVENATADVHLSTCDIRVEGY